MLSIPASEFVACSASTTLRVPRRDFGASLLSSPCIHCKYPYASPLLHHALPVRSLVFSYIQPRTFPVDSPYFPDVVLWYHPRIFCLLPSAFPSTRNTQPRAFSHGYPVGPLASSNVITVGSPTRSLVCCNVCPCVPSLV